ncbi:hypothetical protein I7I48_03237 [Histoplasma ohiense]|nr:hypothetical protein I7I48_03237 [Histoplasma ohiense (nom. inval.)]
MLTFKTPLQSFQSHSCSKTWFSCWLGLMKASFLQNLPYCCWRYINSLLTEFTCYISTGFLSPISITVYLGEDMFLG